jgi:hypothetical protein
MKQIISEILLPGLPSENNGPVKRTPADSYGLLNMKN